MIGYNVQRSVLVTGDKKRKQWTSPEGKYVVKSCSGRKEEQSSPLPWDCLCKICVYPRSFLGQWGGISRIKYTAQTVEVGNTVGSSVYKCICEGGSIDEKVGRGHVFKLDSPKNLCFICLVTLRSWRIWIKGGTPRWWVPAGRETFQEEFKERKDYMVAVIRKNLKDI